jgi:hypothetical protein
MLILFPLLRSYISYANSVPHEFLDTIPAFVRTIENISRKTCLDLEQRLSIAEQIYPLRKTGSLGKLLLPS